MGISASKCIQCGVEGHAYAQCNGAVCSDCGLVVVKFPDDKAANQREIDKHRAEAHAPKEKAIECPVKASGGPCRKGDSRRFGDWGAAVQHVEMGGCGFGREAARNHIYRFVNENSPEFINRQIQYQPRPDGTRPDKPYACNLCSRTFNYMYSLTSHAQAVHNKTYKFNAERNMIKTEQPSLAPVQPIATAPPNSGPAGAAGPSAASVPAVTLAPAAAAAAGDPAAVEPNNNDVKYETVHDPTTNKKYLRKVQVIEIVEIDND